MLKPGEKIRVLIVDDSALMRKRISELISKDHRCEVVGVAANGEDAIAMVQTLKPDVVTLDIQMKGMDGLTCLKYIMSEWPTPVVMVSAFTQYLAEATFKALEYGAVDFVPKPSGTVSRDIETVAYELLSKIKVAARVDISKLTALLAKAAPKVERKIAPSLNKLVVIGSSTGGPRALAEILPKFSPDITAGILVVQHTPEEFTGAFASRLDWQSSIRVKEAEDGEPLEAGKALVAPSGHHMTIKRMGAKGADRIALNKEAKEHGMRPSIDATMRSAAPLYGESVIGVILTGMGEDGTAGLRIIKEYGGTTIAEDPSSCMAYGMPKSAIDAGVVDDVVPLPGIVDKILTRIKRG